MPTLPRLGNTGLTGARREVSGFALSPATRDASFGTPFPSLATRIAARPLALLSPVVGAVIREISFNYVVLPAPFLPMMPSSSPCSTSRLISFNAQT